MKETSVHRLEIAQLLDAPSVRRAFHIIDALADATMREHVAICEIPAPPFGEEQRAQYFERRFRELGLEEVRRDAVGNVMGLRRGWSDRPTIVMSAHLDTIFPSGVDVRVRRRNGRYHAPGIGDNASGLVALLALIEVVQRVRLTTIGTLVFLCTVGEEGEGNLRGVRHFFSADGWAEKTDAFISLDGHGVERIVSGALGSRRYRITIAGPGGHSWGDFGIVNPIHPLAEVIRQLVEYPLPRRPRTSLTVGRIEGGQSVNAIPQSASMDVDIRSTSSAILDQISEYVKCAVAQAVRQENARCAATGTRLSFDIRCLGDRPTGETPPNADIIRIAQEASRLLGIEPQLEWASTDANIPISLGIPAIAMGAGGNAGNPHTLDEWYEATNRELGLKRALLVMLALVGIPEI